MRIFPLAFTLAASLAAPADGQMIQRREDFKPVTPFAAIERTAAITYAGPCEALMPAAGLVAGVILGAVTGYHIERRYFWGTGDDPGLTGMLVGAIVGGIAGVMVASRACNANDNQELRIRTNLTLSGAAPLSQQHTGSNGELSAGIRAAR